MNVSAAVKFGLMETCLGSCCLPGAPRLCRNRNLPKATLHMPVWLDARPSSGRVAEGRALTGDPAGTQAGPRRAHATFFAEGTAPCRSLFLKTAAPALTVFTTCLSDSLGCSRGQNKIPPFSFDLQDTETTAALRTKMAFYAWHLRSRALTGTKGHRQPHQTKSDPTTTSKPNYRRAKCSAAF